MAKNSFEDNMGIELPKPLEDDAADVLSKLKDTMGKSERAENPNIPDQAEGPRVRYLMRIIELTFGVDAVNQLNHLHIDRENARHPLSDSDDATDDRTDTEGMTVADPGFAAMSLNPNLNRQLRRLASHGQATKDEVKRMSLMPVRDQKLFIASRESLPVGSFGAIHEAEAERIARGLMRRKGN